MLGMDRRAARYTWTAALVLLLLALIYTLRRTLFIFILALLFAYLLSPLVNLLDRALPSRTRTPALAMAYVIFVGAVVLAGIQIGSRIAEQAGTLAKNLPSMIAAWEQPSPQLSPMVNSLKAQVVERVRGQLEQGSNVGGLFSMRPVQRGRERPYPAQQANLWLSLLPLRALPFCTLSAARRCQDRPRRLRRPTQVQSRNLWQILRRWRTPEER